MAILNIALAQINGFVGDIVGNTAKVIAIAGRASDEFDANIVVFPELTLTGYPPEDLLLRPSLAKRIGAAFDLLRKSSLDIYIVLGYPKLKDGKLFNVAGVFYRGEMVFEYAKQCLPNYQVFDEKRYFHPGEEPGVFLVGDVKVGMSICEDIWQEGPTTQLKNQQVDLVLNLNASPFHLSKQVLREDLVKKRAKELGAPIIFVNWVGGQDELVFDGGSIVSDAGGNILGRCPLFEESLLLTTYHLEGRKIAVADTNPHRGIAPVEDDHTVAYQALVLGVRDYVDKNGFKGVVLGLSGGIDSALTLAIAADAIGPERVEAVMMPFTYTSKMSLNDAAKEAEALGVGYRSIDIERIYKAFISSLSASFSGMEIDKTEENIQARSRGVILMALSNKLGYLVLTTGNKSEMAVGYATLYGDMAGGLDVLKDVPKTLVFELAKYRNSLDPVIPESVISRPPSAELAPDQKDEDTLPPYDILDQILKHYIEEDLSYEQIVDKGFASDQVRQIIRMVDLNEYKRRQAPIGIRISERAFGRDRRYPITNGWHIGE